MKNTSKYVAMAIICIAIIAFTFIVFYMTRNAWSFVILIMTIPILESFKDRIIYAICPECKKSFKVEKEE